MSTATTNGKKAATAPKVNRVAAAATWTDERTGLAGLAKKQVRKVFPDHWSC
jgi:ubiquinol-cytochrome c reductase cytochrome b subunit